MPRRVLHERRAHLDRGIPMFLLRLILNTVVLGFVTKALGRFFPILLRFLRLIKP